MKRIVHAGFGLLALCLAGDAFEFEDVRAMAQALAAKPFQPSREELPAELLRLSYVEHRAIRFNQQKALWKDEKLPFEIEFFHPGYFHKQVVTLHQIDGDRVGQIPFNAEFFDYGTNRLRLPQDLGFAGFRVTHPLKDFGEVGSFVGASYFRMIGRGQIYGSSARGLALNTVLREEEEFPSFQQFWLRKPRSSDKELIVYALLDSPSVAGAYRFIIRPGTNTLATVRAALFPRRELKEFGIAPLTSMFLHGENGRALFDDFRPEVHDADGLLMQSGRGEWIWHPFEKGRMMRVNAFKDENPRGFGLLQRDRDFDHYQDLVAHFERRPSVWVRPLGNWGQGAVRLVQLPSDREFFDNVVAFWVPATPPTTGTVTDVEYELHWTKSDPAPIRLGRVEATRIGEVVTEPPRNPPHLRFVVDFGGEALESLTAKEQLSARVEHGPDVQFVADSLLKNDMNQTWRLVIEIVQPAKQWTCAPS
jgi:glucans biosynthesis protein